VKKKQKEKDIDNMKEPEYDEEQINPHHNNLEEPPEAEDMQLDENFGLEGDDDKEKDNTKDMEDPFDIDKMKENMNLDDQPEENNEEGEEK